MQAVFVFRNYGNAPESSIQESKAAIQIEQVSLPIAGNEFEQVSGETITCSAAPDAGTPVAL